MNDRVLVTGAEGFVGRHLLASLSELPLEVLQHCRRNGDIAHCELPFEGVGHVFHLAGRSFVPESWTNPRPFYETNVLGTINVLEFCRKHHAAITLISSYVYGHPQSLPICEDHPLEAFNPYAHSKIMAEDAARYYATQHGVRVTVVRPFNIYGPGQSDWFLIPMLIKQALDPEQSTITVADLRPRRDFLHVTDLAALLIATLRGPAGIYNAGSGSSLSVADLTEIINSLLPARKEARSREVPRAQEVLDVRADISRAEAVLGWHPRVSLKDGIADLLGLTGRQTQQDNETH